ARLEWLLRGGPQDEGRRAGPETVAGILSRLAALEMRESALAAETHPMPGPSLERSGGPRAAPVRPPPGRGQGRVRAAPADGSVQPAAVRPRLSWRDSLVERIRKALPGAEVIGIGRQRLWKTACAVMTH